MSITFPESFVWGAATAAHQIEGNNVNSDWWAREVDPASTLAEPSGDAADSYHRYADDIRLLAESGLTSYRFSIEWARIEPAEGRFSRAEVDHYRRMIDCCLEHGVTPLVTLHHSRRRAGSRRTAAGPTRGPSSGSRGTSSTCCRCSTARRTCSPSTSRTSSR